MTAVLDAVLPVFALIDIGYPAGGRGLLGPAVADALNLLVAWLALPAPLFATPPTGTSPFMPAKLYGREAAATSRAILLSTVLSVATVSALVIAMGR